MTKSARIKFHWAALALIMVVAFVLRVYGNDFDLPHISHPDEHHEVHRALKLGAGSFEFDRVFKGGYFYLLFVLYGLMFVVLFLTGTVESMADYMSLFFRDPTLFWLVGRTATAVISTLNIGLVYMLARTGGYSGAGLLAAAFLAVSSLSVLNAHFITVDVLLTFFCLLAAWFSLRLYASPARVNYVLAAVAVGCALATKLSAAPVVFTVIVAHFLCQVDHGRPWFKWINLNLTLFVLLSVVVFVAGQPGAPLFLLDTVHNLLSGSTEFHGHYDESKVTGFEQLAYYGRATQEYMGWPLMLLVVAGVVSALLRRDRYDWILLVFPVLLYLSLTVSDSAFLRSPRYVLPAFPFLILLAAKFAITSLGSFSARWFGIGAVAVLSTAVIVQGALASISVARSFKVPGTPVQCRNWIEAHVPEGSRILIQGFEGISDERRICPLHDERENMLEFARELEPRSAMGAKLVRERAAVTGVKRYDLTIIEPSSEWLSIDTARDAGVQYVVTYRYALDREVRPGDLVAQSRLDSYRDLVTRGQGILLQDFEPSTQYKDGASRRRAVVELFELK
jgi:hypothetical protein